MDSGVGVRFRPIADIHEQCDAPASAEGNTSMAPLKPPPKIKLSRLRDIGWSRWDPIGLLDAEEKWDDEENQHFADEYDGYLLEVAGMLRRGSTDAEVVDFLVEIETVRIGINRSDALERAVSVVEAIRADDKLWTYSE